MKGCMVITENFKTEKDIISDFILSRLRRNLAVQTNFIIGGTVRPNCLVKLPSLMCIKVLCVFAKSPHPLHLEDPRSL